MVLSAKLDKVEIYSKKVYGHHSFIFLTLWSSDQLITWLITNVISQRPRDLATKLDRVVSFNVCLLSIESNNLFITWSHEVTWQMKNVINSLSRGLSLTNFTEGWLMIRSRLFNHKATYSFDHVVKWVQVDNESRYVFTSTNYGKL